MRHSESLHELIKNGNLSRLESLIPRESRAFTLEELEALDPIELMTPACLAARAGNPRVLELLVARGVMLSRKGVGDVLFWSRQQPTILEYLRKLLSENAEVAKTNPDITLPHIHAALGDVEFFRNNPAQLNQANRLGVAPSFYVDLSAHKELSKMLHNDTPITVIRATRSPDDARTRALYYYEVGNSLFDSGYKIRCFTNAIDTLYSELAPLKAWEKRLAALSVSKRHLSGDKRYYDLSELLSEEFQFRDIMILIEAAPQNIGRWIVEEYLELKKPLADYISAEANDKDLRLLANLNSKLLPPQKWLLEKIQNKNDAEYRFLALLNESKELKFKLLGQIKEKNDQDFRKLAENCENQSEKVTFLEAIKEKNFDDLDKLLNIHQNSGPFQNYEKAIFYAKEFISCAEKILKKPPHATTEKEENIAFRKRSRGYCFLGKIYESSNRIDEAYEAYQQVDRKVWADSDVLNFLSTFYLIHKKLSDLNTLLDHVLPIYEKEKAFFPSANAHCLKGFSYWEESREDLAMPCFKEAVRFLRRAEKNPGFAWIFPRLFDMAIRMPLNSETWLPFLRYYADEKEILEDIKSFFEEKFYQATETEQEAILSFLQDKAFKSVAQPFFATQVSPDAACKAARTPVLWGRSAPEANASSSLFANACLYQNEKKLDINRIISLCTEDQLKHYFKLSLGKNPRSEFGIQVANFLIGVVIPFLNKKGIDINNSNMPEDKTKNQNTARLFVYSAWYSSEKANPDLVAFTNLILRAMELYPAESSVILIQIGLQKLDDKDFLTRLFNSALTQGHGEEFLQEVLEKTKDDNLDKKDLSLFCNALITWADAIATDHYFNKNEDSLNKIKDWVTIYSGCMLESAMELNVTSSESTVVEPSAPAPESFPVEPSAPPLSNDNPNEANTNPSSSEEIAVAEETPSAVAELEAQIVEEKSPEKKTYEEMEKEIERLKAELEKMQKPSQNLQLFNTKVRQQKESEIEMKYKKVIKRLKAELEESEKISTKLLSVYSKARPRKESDDEAENKKGHRRSASNP